MSLEQAITENTATMRELIEAISKSFAVFGQAPQKSGQKTAETGQVKPEPEQNTPLTESKPTEPQAPQAPSIPTEQETIRCLMELAKKERTRAVAILTQFRVSKASELKEDQRAEFMEAVNLQLKELEGK
ncbi:hypothetical protein [Gilliamella mensalis]|uniref:hypothetical protein n=1 Tax=Gilliamella mensalis TaxID=1908520 RepID=UPI000A159E21|nr:hypothetical protein [Gilliamella mensalis]